MDRNLITTNKKNLLEEISLLIKDELIATYTQEENSLLIHLLNGQTFRISIEEIN